MKNLFFVALTALSISACATIENTTGTTEKIAEVSVPHNNPIAAESLMAENVGHEVMHHISDVLHSKNPVK